MDLSVVIPTRDRWGELRATLDALAGQDPGGARWELIVVDNGSTDAAPELPGAQLVREPAPGAAAARNRGIAEARGAIVLFLGDDCRPAVEGFLRGHLDAHASADARAVVGGIEWDPGLERTEVMDWLERAGHMVDLGRLRAGPAGPETFYTGNVSVPRSALLEVAGFDQRFAGYGFEDLDLGLRLADRGVGFEHRAELLVHHSHRYGFAESIARMRSVGRGAHLLHSLHDHRRPLPGPPAGRRRIASGLALAATPAAGAPPRWLGPARARDAWLRAAHLAAFADGYASEGPDEDPALRGYGAVPRFTDDPRPAVSVVMPFRGSDEEGVAALAALGRVRLRDDDEAILVDNGGAPAAGEAAGVAAGEDRVAEAGGRVAQAGGAIVVEARGERSSYHARNAGAERASADWVLFLDADTRPPATLLDDYFREPIDERCGAVAGGVVAARSQRALVARYAASRRALSQAAHLRDAHRPYGITANLLVRRAAYDEVGGFLEGLRSGGDADFCWRIQDAGWSLAYREPAAVEHLHREQLVPLLRQMARYSAAIAWQDRRLPGSAPRPLVSRRLARAAGGAAGWLAAGRGQRSLFKALDGLVVLAEGAGWLMSNDAPRPWRPATVALVASEHPTAASVEAAARLGEPAVEAARRPERPVRGAPTASFGEDDGVLRRLGALLWLALRGRRGTWELAAPARRLARAGVRDLHVVPGDEEGGGRAAQLRRLVRGR